MRRGASRLTIINKERAREARPRRTAPPAAHPRRHTPGGTRPQVVKTLGVGEEGDFAVVGTLFKQQRLRPSVLDEYTKDGALKQVRGWGG